MNKVSLELRQFLYTYLYYLFNLKVDQDKQKYLMEKFMIEIIINFNRVRLNSKIVDIKKQMQLWLI